jgi:hypothetical protein
MSFRTMSMALVSCAFVGVAHAQFEGVRILERNWNDSPTSTLTTTNNYPTQIRFQETGLNSGFANQHQWRFSSDGGASDHMFGTNDYWFMSMTVNLATNNPSIRKEAGFYLDGAGDGKFMVASDGEVAIFGGPLLFHTFGNIYTAGTDIEIAWHYFFDTVDSLRKIEYFANGVSSGVKVFDNLEQGLLPNTILGGYGQFAANATTPQTADAQFNNINAVPEPATMLALAMGAGALIARRRRNRA